MVNSQKTVKITLKIPLLGEGTVGKTTLVQAFMGGEISSGAYKATMGAEIGLKRIDLNINDEKKVEVTIQIWDLAGQPAFSKVRQTFYLGSMGAILVYDLGRFETLDKLDMWLEEFYSVIPKPVPVALVGNKKDLRGKGRSMLTTRMGEEKASEITKKSGFETPFVEASAIRSENADYSFERLATVIYENLADLV